MKRLLLAFASLVVCLLLLEAAAVFSSFALPNFFNDFSGDRLKRLSDFEAYQAFLESNYDANTGWKNLHATSLTKTNCLGRSVTYTLDNAGARVTPLSGPAQIVTVGDSFTFGEDVEDEESYPSRLTKKLNIKVANHGVSAFGPVQALLRLEEKLSSYPQAKIVILSIMFENIRRMRNAYRPAIVLYPGGEFAFKPYVEIIQQQDEFVVSIRANPNRHIATSQVQLQKRAEHFLLNDYWSRERKYFPYTFAIFNNLKRPSQQMRIRGWINQKLGFGKYWADYHEPEFQAGILEIARRFALLARKNKLQGKIFFLPDTWHALESPDRLIARINQEVESALAVNVGKMDLKGIEYIPRSPCFHPTPAGYSYIAEFMANELRIGTNM